MTLLFARRFLPLFATQALGAVADNMFKNAIVVLIAFRSRDALGQGGEGHGGAALVAVAGGLFILPYLLFSAPAGQAADRFAKAWLIRMTKWAELLISVLAAAALLWGGAGAWLGVLFLYGVQAAVFSPLKYGSLPELLAPAELLRGNAHIEAGTFAAILLGTIAGGVLIGAEHGPALVGGALVAISALGVVAARAIPDLRPRAPALLVELNLARSTLHLLAAARANRSVWVALLGLSWFWTLGATFLAQFPVLAQGEFHADNRVVTLLLACFSVGVGLGSVAVGLVSRARARRLAGAAGLALSVGTAAFAGLAGLPAASSWGSPAAMLGSAPGLAALICLLLVSAAGGAFSVPLYARLQTDAAPDARARIVAANNIMNAVCIVAGAAVLAGLAAAGLRPGAILLVAAAVNAAVAIWLRRALPAVAGAHSLGHESA